MYQTPFVLSAQVTFLLPFDLHRGLLGENLLVSSIQVFLILMLFFVCLFVFGRESLNRQYELAGMRQVFLWYNDKNQVLNQQVKTHTHVLMSPMLCHQPWGLSGGSLLRGPPTNTSGLWQAS